MLKLVAICSGVFGLAVALEGGEAVAQSMSTSNCMAMGQNMVHCDTIDMTPPASPPPVRPSPSPSDPVAQGGEGNPGLWGLLPQDKQHNPLRDTLGAIGDAFLVQGGAQPQYAQRRQAYEERLFRMKVGKLLADGDCQGAARLALESGRLELGQSITGTCHADRASVAAVAQPPAPPLGQPTDGAPVATASIAQPPTQQPKAKHAPPGSVCIRVVSDPNQSTC